MSSEWTGDDFFDEVRGQVRANIATAADVLKKDLKDLISVQGPPRSSPGNPPHRDTGKLYDSIRVAGPTEDGDVISASVGTDVLYGEELELGTDKVAARPWLGRTLRDNQENYAQIITHGEGQ